MFLFCVLSLVIANRVKIVSKDSPEYILTMLGGLKENGIRFMKESEIDNPTHQSGFELDGEKTVLYNYEASLCGSIWGSDVKVCPKTASNAAVFNVIKTDNDVTFKTDGGKCLTMSSYDPPTKGYFVELKKCKDKPSQKFKLVDIPKIEETKTPLAPLPNETNGNNSNNNGNSQNTVNGTCSNVNISNIGFKPVSCYSNISLITDGPSFNDYVKGVTGVCGNTNQSRGPTSFTSVYKFRRPAQPGNECNNHQIWSGTFRRSY